MAAKRPSTKQTTAKRASAPIGNPGRPSALLDTRIVYCGDCLDQLANLPDGCVDLIYIDPPFNSNRNYEVFWGEGREKRAFEDRHASTQAYIDYMRPALRRACPRAQEDRQLLLPLRLGTACHGRRPNANEIHKNAYHFGAVQQCRSSSSISQSWKSARSAEPA